MEEKITKIRFRRDTEANWSAANPIPDCGEPIVVLNDDGSIKGFKIGDGNTEFDALDYQTDDYTSLEHRVDKTEQDIETINSELNPENSDSQIYTRITKDEGDINNLSTTLSGVAHDLGVEITNRGSEDDLIKEDLQNNYQKKLTAGDNITITQTTDPVTGNVTTTISATDTKYTAGENISISDENVISATGISYTAGEGIIINNQEISSVIPEVPNVYGVYTLKCVVQNNKLSYGWQRDVPPFSFNIETNSYYGGSNINWMTWVTTIYNTDGYSIQDNARVVDKNNMVVVDNGTPVQPLDTIISGTTYTLQAQVVE